MDARNIVETHGGTWYGRYGTMPCPCCQPEGRKDQTALTVTDGIETLLLNCKKSFCEFEALLAALGLSGDAWSPPDPTIAAKRQADEHARAKKKAAQAQMLYVEAMPLEGTLGEHYLRRRGIRASLPASLRFHPNCYHSPSAKRFPAIVGAVTHLSGSGMPSVHRTFLNIDGTGKIEHETNKMMLGGTKGGCVRLSDGSGPLVASEGIETGLSLLSGLLSVSDATVVATLSTSGMRSLTLPRELGKLIIAPDGDEPGREAAVALGMRASAMGWDVELLPCPAGCDFNNLLQMQQQQRGAA